MVAYSWPRGSVRSPISTIGSDTGYGGFAGRHGSATARGRATRGLWVCPSEQSASGPLPRRSPGVSRAPTSSPALCPMPTTRQRSSAYEVHRPLPSSSRCQANRRMRTGMSGAVGSAGMSPLPPRLYVGHATFVAGVGASGSHARRQRHLCRFLDTRERPVAHC
jgi:hypothetical protein